MILPHDDLGDPQAPALVLLHGLALDGSMWSEIASGLAERCRLILPDLRGQGRAQVPTSGYEIDDLADDVVETLDDLGIDRCVLGGLSMGGYVALSIAVRRPDRLRGLLLLQTRAGAHTPAAAEARRATADAIERSGDLRDFADSLTSKLFAESTYTAQPALVQRVRDAIGRTDPSGLARTLRGLASRPDRTSALPSIDVPTLVVAGIDDRIVPLEEARELAARIPGAGLVEIDRAGHLSPLEAPEPTSQAIRDYLERL
ncbi:MAG: alpha/beta fold hydrolase [Isosphaeraceae bacterium]|nr:alpha/beta fold hydrolase [Isosphaeraceae bacterium]